MTAGPELTPPDYGRMRTSQADRERAIDVLKAAFAEGRLDQDEYTERAGLAHASRTYAELAGLTADLPVGPLGTLPGSGGSPLPAVPGSDPGSAAAPARRAVPLPPPAAPARPVSQLAIASLLFGIATLVVPATALTLFAAIILGIAALARISTTSQRGVGLALSGIGLALLGTMSPYLGIFFR